MMTLARGKMNSDAVQASAVYIKLAIKPRG